MIVHPIYLIALLFIAVVVFAPVIAVVVLATRSQRRSPILLGPASNQAADGTWISADGHWKWDGQAWVRRSEGPSGAGL
jgi:hypothetical protein